LYVSGRTRGVVKPQSDGYRLKIEAQDDSIAAEWPVAASLKDVVESIERHTPERLTMLGSMRGATGRRFALARLERQLKSTSQVKFKGAHHLYALTEGPRGYYSLACRLPATEWSTVAVPLLAETAVAGTQDELSRMYRQLR